MRRPEEHVLVAAMSVRLANHSQPDSHTRAENDDAANFGVLLVPALEGQTTLPMDADYTARRGLT